MKGIARTTTPYLLFFAIALLSFFQFSYRFTPLLNSDIAINILMTPDYTLPGDLYAWGQDRGGSLIPFLAHFVYKITMISPISAVSIVHFGILVLGFFSALPFFKYTSSRLLLALLWFFPPWHFVDFLLFPFGTQVSLMFMGIRFIEWMKKVENLFLQLLLLLFGCLLFIASAWVSDLSLVSLLPLTFLVFWEWVGEFKNTRDWVSLVSRVGVVFILSAVGIAFIIYGKQHATRIDPYSDQPFNTLPEMHSALIIIWDSLSKTFLFSKENPVEGVYAWLIILCIPIVKWFSFLQNRTFISQINFRWFLFFVFNGFLLFLLMVISHWVYLNGVGRRYFVLVYLFFGFAVLQMVETTRNGTKSWLTALLFLIVITGAVSSVYTFYFPKHKPPLVKTLSEFQTLGQIGLIGEYWNAYQSATPDPVSIKATAHDKDYVRSSKLVDAVFLQPKIYVIKDMWMESFPDTLHQFGRTLIKRDTMFYIGACWVNRYELKK